jgi:hypothetical protein
MPDGSRPDFSATFTTIAAERGNAPADFVEQNSFGVTAARLD